MAIDIPSFILGKKKSGSDESNTLAKSIVDRTITEITADQFYGITAVNDYAFSMCRKLLSMEIPEGVVTIATSAYSGCEALQTILLPDTLTIIGNNAFRNCSALQSITVPKDVKTISSGSFFGCSSLTSIVLKPMTPPTLGNSTTFSGITSDAIFYVPHGRLTAYQTATNWSVYASQMVEVSI